MDGYEQDQYDLRIDQLKAAKLEIGGQVVSLAPDDRRREWWHRRAGELDDELRVLLDHADDLRYLDGRIVHEADRINRAKADRLALAATWRSAAWWMGAAAGLALLLSVWTVLLPWTPLATFVLVSASVLARRRSLRLPGEADGFILERGEVLTRLESQRETILRSTGQSPSASSPASTPDRSSGHSMVAPESADSSWS